jgi:hypothetical protein
MDLSDTIKENEPMHIEPSLAKYAWPCVLLSKFQSFLVTAVTIQTSGASRDFALYSLEVLRGRQIYHLYFITPINALAFIRTCAKVLPSIFG